MKTKQIFTAVAIILISTSSFAEPSAAHIKDPKRDTNIEEARGALAGMIIGAGIAGPIGAGVGGIVGGAVFGKMLGTSRIANDLEVELEQQAIAHNKKQEEMDFEIANLYVALDQLVEMQTTNWNRREIPILFRTDSNNIEYHYESQLDEIAQTLSSNTGIKINLSGFADRRGDRDYNQKLSEKRVRQVRTYLINKGVNSRQIQAVAFGESRPLAEQESPENNFFDRRVLMQFTGDVDIATR